MKLLGYPLAGLAPWPLLERDDDIQWMTQQDVIEDFESRGFSYSPELVSVKLELHNLNSKMLSLRCKHYSLDHLQPRWNFLWKEEHRLGAELNPPVYAVGDELDFRMFPTDDPKRVRFTDVSHFDMINGRVYQFEVIGHPDYHYPGARLENLTLPGVRNIESEVAAAKAAVASAHARFYDLGKWRDQRTAYSRRLWQSAKLDVANAERELFNLLKEAKFPQQKLLCSSSSITNSDAAAPTPTVQTAPQPDIPSGPDATATPPKEVSFEPTPTFASLEYESVQEILL